MLDTFSTTNGVIQSSVMLGLWLQCIHIIDRIEDVHIAKEEYYLLKALVLANSDVRLDEVVAPKKFRESILSALTDCVSVTRYFPIQFIRCITIG